MDLKSLADGKECQVNFPEICTSKPTKLKLIRRAGLAGLEQAPPAICGVWTCPTCHDIIRGKKKLAAQPEYVVSLYILNGLLKTLELVSKELDL